MRNGFFVGEMDFLRDYVLSNNFGSRYKILHSADHLVR
jgi:hypothetical protein